MNPNLQFPGDRRGPNRPPRTRWEHLRELASGNAAIPLGILAISLIGILVQAMPYILTGVYSALVGISVALWTCLDFAFGARLGGEVPALMWTLWGAVLGASAAFWLSAPLYGWRKQRALVLLLPLLLMVGTAWVINSRIPPLPEPPEAAVTTPTTPALSNAASSINQRLLFRV